MTEDLYDRIQTAGLLDLLSPYQPVVVGAYPLRIATAETPVEIVCRTVDLPAFARTIERGFGECDGFALHPGSLDGEEAVFAEFELDGIPIEVGAQAEHVHRRLGAATLGIDRVLNTEGDAARNRLAAAVARGEDWLEAALDQLGISRIAAESLASADSNLVRRVLGMPQQPIPLRDYVLPVLIGSAADLLIIASGSARGSQQYTGIMLLLESVVLGAIFGTRLGIVAALVPLIVIGAWLTGPILLGDTGGACGPDCGQALAGYVYVGVLVASGAGIAGAIRDRYFPRSA
jgi:hypothetical protein